MTRKFGELPWKLEYPRKWRIDATEIPFEVRPQSVGKKSSYSISRRALLSPKGSFRIPEIFFVVLVREMLFLIFCLDLS